MDVSLSADYVKRSIVNNYDCLYRQVNAEYAEFRLGESPRTLSFDYTYQFSTSRKTAQVKKNGFVDSQSLYNFNAVNQFTKEKSLTVQDGQSVISDISYSYSRAGNRIGTTISAENTTISTQTYSYDAESRLLSTNLAFNSQVTVLPETVTTQNSTYNGLGEKISDTSTRRDGLTTTTDYVMDRARVLPEPLITYENNAVKDSQLFGMGKIGQLTPTGWNYYAVDGLGSLRVISDAAGNVTEARTYDPFGNTLDVQKVAVPVQPGPSTPVPVASVYGFAGEQTDPNGLIYLRARHYDPRTGSFLSRDSMLGMPGMLSTFNGYSYAEGNPTNNIDPTGRCDAALSSNILLCGAQNLATFGSSFRALFNATTSSLAHGVDYVSKNWRKIAAGVLNNASDAVMSFHRDPFAALAGGINGVLETTVYPLLDAVWFAEEAVLNRVFKGEWKANGEVFAGESVIALVKR